MEWYTILGIVLGSLTIYMMMVAVCYRLEYMLWGDSKNGDDEFGREVSSFFWFVVIWGVIGLLMARLIIKEKPNQLPKARTVK